jgi:myo-inositol catabolism protein IolC
MREIGYDQPLFVQPFDHRGSFTKGFFGLAGTPEISATGDEFSQIAEAKTVVYQGLLRAIEMGVDPATVGLLVDAQFGSHILADAKAKGIPVAVCTEKTGQTVFDFEYGAGWQDQLRFIRPRMAKVLVRLHPQDDAAQTREQMVRLKMLSDYCRSGHDHFYMFELLVPATTPEEKAAGAAYDRDLRPARMIEAIAMLQEFGVEPDIWKIEGLETREAAEAVAAQTRQGTTADGASRAKVGNILLGRGSDRDSVYHWLKVAAPVPGYIGFAVGRTNFSAPLKRFIADASQRAGAIQEIADNFKGCVDTWKAAQGS